MTAASVVSGLVANPVNIFIMESLAFLRVV